MSSHAAEGLARLERELLAEKAAALSRIASSLEGLILELKRLDESRMESRGMQREEMEAAREAALARARLFRWYLEVQREALGLLRHDRLDEFYPLPRSLRGRPSGPAG